MKYLFFYTFTFANQILWAFEVSLAYQNDMYIEQSVCKDSQESRHQALFFSISNFPKNHTENLILNFNESNSSFSQTLLLKKEYFYYPGLFGAKGHREYDTPSCDSKQMCTLDFFVFLKGSILQQKHLNIDLNGYKSDMNFEKNIFNYNFASENLFNQLASSKGLFEGLRLTFNKKSEGYYATIERSKVKKLLDEDYKIEFIFSYRTSTKQKKYSETSLKLTEKSSWFLDGTNQFDLILSQEEIKKLTYLSFLIHASKKSQSFETKVVLLDLQKSISNCP